MCSHAGFYVETRMDNISDRNEVVDKIEDISFLKIVVEKAKANLQKMQITDFFPHVIEDWKKKITTKETNLDENCALTAVLAVVSIGLMNIEDLGGSIDTELEPFIREVRDQLGFPVTHGIGEFLFMSVLSGVSTKTRKVYRGSLTHHPFVRLYKMVTGWNRIGSYKKGSKE